MHNIVVIWITGSLAIASAVASTVLSAITASSLVSDEPALLPLRTIQFTSAATSIALAFSTTYYITFYPNSVAQRNLGTKGRIWTTLSIGGVATIVFLAVPLVALVWSVVALQQLPNIFDQNPIVWIAAWFTTWGLSVVLHAFTWTLLGTWTKENLRAQSVGRLDLDFGIRLPPMGEGKANASSASFASRDTTLASPPRTPCSTVAGSSLRYSLSAKAGLTNTVGTSKPKPVGRGSARSSIETVSHSLPEPGVNDNAFDRWDTSSVHREMRAAVGSSPVLVKQGLETIPGSRPESPADALDGPFLPSSPHVTSSEAASGFDWSSPIRHSIGQSTPPSSPPNFSMPTPRRTPKPESEQLDPPPPLEELIHPLFRSNSPHPPPITTAGTMVTASPMANNPITPKTLERLRSNSHQNLKSPQIGVQSQPRSQPFVEPQSPKRTSTGHWRAMPSIDSTQNNRPSTAGSIVGSPGPSVVDEDELPPLSQLNLPGFVLGAGSRGSMMAYSARKSAK